MINTKKLSIRQLRLPITLAVGIALIVTATLIIVRIPDKTAALPMTEQKAVPRYTKNPAGGTPLSTAQVQPTTPIADLPADAPPLQTLLHEETTAKEATVAAPPVTPVASETQSVAAETSPPPAPKPRPPKKEKPQVADTEEASNAAASEPVMAKPVNSRRQRQEELPETQWIPEQPAAAVKPAQAPALPERRVDNPWEAPAETGFNQK